VGVSNVFVQMRAASKASFKYN